jgi:NADH-quinone oxidoreductase subunit J
MNVVFYVAAAVAVIATVMAITQRNAVHALLYLIVSLLSVALVFYTLGAPFIAALEVIIYAGAIMVLFLFAIMILNLGPQAREQERQWLHASAWVGPAVLAAILLAELIYVLLRSGGPNWPLSPVGPEEVGFALFGRYMVGVELASILLLAGLVGAYHLGRRARPEEGQESRMQEAREQEARWQEAGEQAGVNDGHSAG